MTEAQTCKFFAGGYCARGTACRFLHENNSHRHVVPGLSTTCVFFRRGYCRTGEDCRFSHAPDAELEPGPGPDLPKSQIAVKSRTVTRSFGGAEVTFGPGCEIIRIKLPEPDVLCNKLPLSSITLTWERASRSIKLGYESRNDALQAMTLLERRRNLFLHRLSHISMDRGKITRQFRGFVVTLKDALVDVTTETLEQTLSRTLPWSMIKFEDPTYDDQGRMGSAMEKYLQKFGSITRFTIFKRKSGDKSGYQSATVRFDTPETAQKVLGQFHKRRVMVDSLGLVMVTSEPQISVKISVRTAILEALREEFRSLLEKHQSIFCSVKPPDVIRKIRVIFLWGTDSEAVARAKTAVSILFAGSTAVDHESSSAVWHPSFNTASGLKVLKDIMEQTNIFIFRDSANFCLRFYGPATCRDAALASLLAYMKPLDQTTWRISLSEEELSTCLRGPLMKLQDKYGLEAVRLEMSGKRPSIVFQGSDQDYENALEVLQVNPLNDFTYGGSDINCPICFTEPSDPIILSCNHTYCKQCLASQTDSTCNGSSEFPIKCFARANRSGCNTSIDLDQLRDTLMPEALERAFKHSLGSFVIFHPKKYRNCPTPDCGQLYRPYDGEHHDDFNLTPAPPNLIKAFHCPSCLSTTCTRCALPAHPQLTCADAVDLSKGGTKLFDKYKSENDVRDCPKCKTPIEKRDGCNHMTCAACKVHICWFCMEVFDDGDKVYDHMEDEHDGMDGDEDSDEDWEDGDDSGENEEEVLNEYDEDDEDDDSESSWSDFLNLGSIT